MQRNDDCVLIDNEPPARVPLRYIAIKFEFTSTEDTTGLELFIDQHRHGGLRADTATDADHRPARDTSTRSTGFGGVYG
jgi:hypothetical protein